MDTAQDAMRAVVGRYRRLSSKGQTAVQLLIVLAVLAAGVVVAQIVQSQDEGPTTTIDLSSLTSAVVYELDGSVNYADITIVTPDGMEQITADVPLMNRNGDVGLHLTFPAGEFVSISAQKPGERGTLTCRIKVDGRVVSENTSTAAYGIASCDGRS